MFGEKIILHYKYNYPVTDATDKRKDDPSWNNEIQDF